MLKLTKLLTEGKETYDYGCVMLYSNFPSEIIKLQDTINPTDLQDPGIEYEPHCTLLYGLHDGVTLDQVTNIVNQFKFSNLRAFNPSLFENPEFDVLKYDIGYQTNKDSSLHQCNQKLKILPNTQTYPDYHPHMTIAYLKPGKGKEYMEMFKNKGANEFMTTPSHIMFSQPDGTKTKIKL
jgi:2'-5' RNA ligase